MNSPGGKIPVPAHIEVPRDRDLYVGGTTRESLYRSPIQRRQEKVFRQRNKETRCGCPLFDRSGSSEVDV